jgi:hypothetical protein
MKHFNYNIISYIFKDRKIVSLNIEEVKRKVNHEAEKGCN